MKLTVTVAALKRGETVALKSPTHHLSPILAHGQDVTIAPIADMTSIKEDDIVLADVGSVCLRIVRHFRMGGLSVSGMNRTNTSFVSFDRIFGVVQKPESDATNDRRNY